MKTQLIIVDGHCSVGKSSLSKSVYHQIRLQREAYWLHEECDAHPIRHNEFSFGDLTTVEGMERNRLGMLQKWAAFRDSIGAAGKVCVTEGCLLHAYDRYFIDSLWSDNDIAGYYAQVIEAIRPLDPLIVFLYRPDLRSSLEKAFTARGKWWRDLILRRDDAHVYFRDHVYEDENSMFEAVAFEQNKMMEFFDGLTCAKLKIDTSEERWDAYVQQITSFLGLQFTKTEPHPCDLRLFTGTYQWLEGSAHDEWIINYDEANRCLFTSLFWPYMPMRCAAENVFELISFPVELRFNFERGEARFSVHGNYDWEYNNQVFVRV